MGEKKTHLRLAFLRGLGKGKGREAQKNLSDQVLLDSVGSGVAAYLGSPSQPPSTILKGGPTDEAPVMTFAFPDKKHLSRVPQLQCSLPTVAEKQGGIYNLSNPPPNVQSSPWSLHSYLFSCLLQGLM